MGDGHYKIIAVQSGRAIQVSPEDLHRNGAAIQISDWTNANNQKWTITSSETGFPNVIAAHSGLALDVNFGAIPRAGGYAH